MTDEVLASDAHRFTIERTEKIRLIRVKAQAGDMVFSGKITPAGAIIDYYLKDDADEDSISLRVPLAYRRSRRNERGVHRVVWDLRHEKLYFGAPDCFSISRSRSRSVCPFVIQSSAASSFRKWPNQRRMRRW